MFALLLLAACTAPEPPSAPALPWGELSPIGACDLFDSPGLRGLEDLEAMSGEPALLAGMGVRVARPHRPGGHAFARQVVKPRPAAPADWTLPDWVVTRAQEQGISLMVTLFDAIDPSPGAGHVGLFVAPDQEHAWRAFVTALVERYDGDGVDDMPGLRLPVLGYEIGNETFCAPSDQPCRERILRLHRMSAEAIRAADDRTLVMAGGAAPVLRVDGERNAAVESLYRYLFGHGLGGVVDVLPFHVMVGVPSPPLPAYLEVWRELAPAEPLWLSETGVHNPHQPRDIAADPALAPLWTERHLREAVDGGVERVLWCRAQGSWTEPQAVVDQLRAFNGASAAVE
jgi:hypothetical protein